MALDPCHFRFALTIIQDLVSWDGYTYVLNWPLSHVFELENSESKLEITCK